MAQQMGPILLGEGAFGKVYKETKIVNKTPRVCAVKKLENFKPSAVKEVETLMKLNHPRIVNCYGHYFEDNGRRLCIVMEFCDRGTFTKLVANCAKLHKSVLFMEGNIWEFVADFSFVLEYLHTRSQPILHRDLKPDNILGKSSAQGYLELRLADFGLVKLMAENVQGDFYANTICGTPTYMAPEVCNCPVMFGPG